MRSDRPARLMVVALAAIVAMLGLLTVAAWAVGSWHVLTLGPAYAPITPTSGLLFLILGSGLAIAAAKPGSATAWTVRVWSARLTIAGTLASVVRTALFPLPTTIIWSPTIPMPPAHEILGLISPWTALSMLLAALGLRFAPERTNNPRARTVAAAATGLGMIVSVVFVLGYLSGTPVLYGQEVLPMTYLAAIGFLLLNLALLGWQVHAIIALDSVDSYPDADPRKPHQVESAVFVIVLAGAATVVLLMGFFFLRREQGAARSLVRSNLQAIAYLKSAQVAQWRDERIREVRVLFGSNLRESDISNFARRPEDTLLRRRALTWIESVRSGRSYRSVSLVDTRGRSLLSTGDRAAPAIPTPPPASPNAGWIEFERGAHGASSPSFLVFAPLNRADTPEDLVGYAVVEVDPSIELFRIVADWPLPSHSAEAYLVERRGDQVAALSSLRFRPAGGPILLGPVENRRLTAAAAARGEYGLVEGLDYRDVPVIAVSLPIPGSNWVLLAELDQSEAYANVVAEAWQAAVLVTLVLAVLLLSGAYYWRHRRSESLRQSLVAEHNSRALAERLALVSQNANDAILLFGEDMRIIEANDRVATMYGRTPLEMTSLTALDLRSSGDHETATALFRKIFEGSATIFEAVHVRADGTSFPVEVNSRPVNIMGRPHVLSVIRDITERKAHEREIERLSRLYAALAHVNQSVAQAADREALLVDACRSLVEAGGFETAWIGWPNEATGCLDVVADWGDSTGYVHGLHVTLSELPRGRGPSGTAFREKRTVISNDFVNDPRAVAWREAARQAGFAAAASLPVRVGGKPTAVLTVYASEAGYFGPPEVALLEQAARDVGFGLQRLDREHAREAAEAEREASDERLRLALSVSRQGIYDVDLATGTGVVTEEYALMLGHDPAVFVETSEALRERIHPEDQERALRVFRDAALPGGGEFRVEFRLRTASGEYKWIQSVGRIVSRNPDGSPARMLGVHTDISERKQYEAEILAVRERLEATVNAIPDLLFELTRDGTYLSFHSPRTDLLAAPAEAFIGKRAADILPPDAAEATRLSLAEADEKGRSNGCQFRLDLPQGSSWFELSIAKAPGASGEETRFVALSRDITDRKKAEEEIRDSLREKEALLKEVHHRVKNNLQVITSLLRLEGSRSHESGTKVVLKDMQNRIRSMALLHETLYQTGNFAAVNLADYLRRLASQLFRAHRAAADIHLLLDLEPVSLSIDLAIPCGLIVNELLTNSLKHAFASKSTGAARLRLRLGEAPRVIELQVSDDGVGLPADFATRQSNSLGMQLVSDLTRQIRGELEIGPGPGTSFTIRFPPDEAARRTGPTERSEGITGTSEPGAVPAPPPEPQPPRS